MNSGTIKAAGKTETAIPELMALCNHIHSRIQDLEDCSKTINSAIWRLLSPRPIEVGKDGGDVPPDPNTIEANLSSIVRRLERLNGYLSEHAKNLDSAV